MNVATDLLNWYDQNKRDLPWRHTKNPFYIWVSEVMLQQTQVDTVIPYWNKFIDRFKTMEDLANASQNEVYKHWEGLGYYSRVRNLQEATKCVIEKHQGVLEKDINFLLSLKGIGPYTARAIGSIAFDINTFALDGNGLRIISRLYALHDNIALNKTLKTYQTLGDTLVEGVNAGDFNQAIMDLGATICRPKKPLCQDCPLSKHCLAYQSNQQYVLPINIKKKNNIDIHYITGIIYYNDQYFLLKNKEGLLSNLYGCVQYELESPYSFIETFKEEYGLTLQIETFVKDIKHVFSHRTWYMHVYVFKLDHSCDHLYTKKEISDLPISTAHLKVFKALDSLCLL